MLFYLLGYVFSNLGAFGVVIAVAHCGRDADRIEDFAGIARSRPVLAALMTLFLLSLAGIPGTLGFAGRLQVFLAACARAASGSRSSRCSRAWCRSTIPCACAW